MWRGHGVKVGCLTTGGLMDLPAAGRRVETEYEARSKACHEKSAEAIVGMEMSHEKPWRSHNFRRAEPCRLTVNECYRCIILLDAHMRLHIIKIGRNPKNRYE